MAQILNYVPILSGGQRYLPLHFRPDDERAGEIVFLRLFQHVSDQRILFFPTTLLLDPAAEEPVRVHASRRVETRPWRAGELARLLENRGFQVALHGDMESGPFLADSSQDLVLLAQRPV